MLYFSRGAKRESLHLWTAILIVLVLSGYRLTVEMLPEFEAFFAIYTNFPVALYLMNGLFFWLLALLWIAYRRWRAAVAAKQELERVLMSISPDSLVVINRNREITMCTGQVEAMFGLKDKDLIGKKTDVLYYDRRQRGEKGEIANRLERFGFHVGYATGKRMDGGTFPLEVITGTIRYKQGAVILMRDITERCNIEDALRNSEARFDLFMKHLPGFAFIKDSRGRRVYMNNNYERFYGWDLAEALGKTDAQLHDNHELAKQFAETDAAVMAENRTIRYVSHIDHKDGERALLTVKFPMPAGENGEAMIGGLSLDITEQEAAERERRNIEQQMQQAQKLESLGVLAGGIAHDFNNLLMGILGHADLALNDTSDTENLHRNLNEVIAASQRAADLANQLLAYSGKGKFTLEVVNLTRLIEDLAGLIKVSVSKKALLHFDLNRQMPQVECDATQVRQVLMNLIRNASDALEEKPGTITIETGAGFYRAAELGAVMTSGISLADGEYAYVRITDSGIGMDKETLARIFDPFFTTKFAGHGLGLAAAIGIIRSHHGTIAITSTLGKGAAFTIYLPTTAKTIPPPATEDHHADTWTGSGTILVADDEETVRDVARMMLETLGFDVLCVDNGKEAIEVVQQNGNAIQAVLLDLTMPVLGGKEAFKQIRILQPDLPVIISSGYNKEEDMQHYKAGAKPLFLKKPYRLQSIRDVFRQALAS